MAALKQLLINSNFHKKSASLFSSSSPQFSLNNQAILPISNGNSFKRNKITYCSKNRRNIYLPRAEPRKDGIVPVEEDDDGVSLGTFKLPGNTDVARFETLLFQVQPDALILFGAKNNKALLDTLIFPRFLLFIRIIF
jgi:hypothetical protein